MFVDDSFFVTTALIINHEIEASIEALYIVLCFLDLTASQDPLSLDRYFQSVCPDERIQLGKIINTRTMSISITELKGLAII